MGTLGCINDMLRRDKENRELHRRSRERMKDTHLQLLQVKENRDAPQISAEQLEHIQKDIQQKAEREWKETFWLKLSFLSFAVVIVFLVWLLFF